MANASAKRIASQNELAIKILRLGMFLPTLLSFLLRFFFHSSTLPPSKGSIVLYTLTFFPAFFLSNYLVKIGTIRKDPISGTLISYGEDLGQPGVTEWCFDIVYVTWACQVGSGAFGDWFWWLYLVIPLYAVFKVWTSFIGPTFFNGLGSSSNTQENGAAGEGGSTSKRQEKLRKRGERGDPRVKTQTVRR